MDLNIAFQTIGHMFAYDVFGSYVLLAVFIIGLMVFLAMKTGINPLILGIVVLAPTLLLLATHGYLNAWITGAIYILLAVITGLGLWRIFASN